jgi:hypothetical protein
MMNTQTTQTEFTRQQYLNNECSHREYYSQLVTKEILNAVSRRFGIDKLKAAIQEDERLNNIPLAAWDGLAENFHLGLRPIFKSLGDFYSLAGGVCVMKEAARQLIETA